MQHQNRSPMEYRISYTPEARPNKPNCSTKPAANCRELRAKTRGWSTSRPLYSLTLNPRRTTH